jgi:hypothetical protein
MQSDTPPQRRWVAFLQARPYTVLTALVLIVFAVPYAQTSNSDWALVYLPAADRLSKGENIYQLAYTYPPVDAWLMIALVGVPDFTARLIWYVISVIGLVILVRGAWTLSGGGRLEGEPLGPRREHIISGLGLLCSAAFLFDALTNQQNDLLVNALVILGCGQLARGRGPWAGLWFGLAAGLKCTPLLWAGYMLYRRQWTGALLVPLVAVGLNLVPDLTHPAKTGESHLVRWGQVFLGPMFGKEHLIGTWATDIRFNQSLNGSFTRWLSLDRNSFTAWADDLRQRALRGEAMADGPPAHMDATTVRMIAYATMLLLVIATFACSLLGDRRFGRPNLPAGPGPSRQALEFSLVLILMVLLSPQSSKPHFCTMILPSFCLARAALAWPSRTILVVFLGALALGLAANKDLVGRPVYDWLKWYGGMTIETVLLFVGCCVGLVYRPAESVVTTSTEPSGVDISRSKS